MKKHILLFALIVLSYSGFSQSYKIMNSAQGDLKEFQSLYDGEELFGYVEIKDLGYESKLEKKFQYTVMDKNLNKINEGEFTWLFRKKLYDYRFNNVIYNKGRIVFGCREYLMVRKSPNELEVKPFRDSYKVLDLSSNKIIAAGIFDKTIDFTKRKKYLTKRFVSYEFAALPEGSFLIESGENSKRKQEQFYYSTDFNADKVWEQPYKTAEEKYKFKYVFVKKEGNTLLFFATKYKGNRKISDHLLTIDATTGKEVSFCDYSNDKNTLKYTSVFIKDNQATFVGRYFEKNKRDYVDYEKSLGLYRRIIDLNSGKIVSDIYVPYSKFGNLNINEFGKIKKEGHLAFQKVNMNPDGSCFIVAETYVEKFLGTVYKEFYTFMFDKDFALKDVKSYDTNKTNINKYAFTQDLPNNVGKAFFFYDKNENKEFELNMLNLNFSSKAQTVDKIKLSTEESYIKLLPAKSGYVTIVEFFKDPKKSGKFMEVRLEKLNYERS